MDDWYKYKNRPDITLREASFIRDRPDITLREASFIREHSKYAEAVAPTSGRRSIVKYKDKILEDIRVVGIVYEEKDVENFEIDEGRFFSPISRKRSVAIIGYEIKERLFEDDDPIGKKILIGGQKFVVVGVRSKRGNIFGQSLDIDVYVPLGTLYSKFGHRRSVGIQVKVKDPSLMEEASEELRFWMRVARALKPTEPDNFSINRQETLLKTYRDLTRGLYTAAFGIGALSLIVGGIGIMNIMLVFCY